MRDQPAIHFLHRAESAMLAELREIMRGGFSTGKEVQVRSLIATQIMRQKV